MWIPSVPRELHDLHRDASVARGAARLRAAHDVQDAYSGETCRLRVLASCSIRCGVRDVVCEICTCACIQYVAHIFVRYACRGCRLRAKNLSEVYADGE